MRQLSFKGLHYRSKVFYDGLTALKLKTDIFKRYKIAASYITEKQSVLDICAGAGDLKKFLPLSCLYTAVEASPQFISHLQEKCDKVICWDLHQGWPLQAKKVDVIVMIISLAQFRKTTVHDLLEAFKKQAQKVVIVEDIATSRFETSWYQTMVNYLCHTQYYVPVAWYEAYEFSQLMQQHGYRCQKVTDRYWIGIYENSSY